MGVRDNIRDQNNCQAVQRFIQSSGEVIQVSEGAPLVAVLGDSYSAGDVLDDRADGWVYQLGEQAGADVRVAGVGMTGYTNGGYCGGQEFANRVDSLLALDPNTLILQGGVNDWEADPADIQAAAADLLAKTEGVERVVMVGPTDAPQRDNLAGVDRALAATATEHGAQYVSALGWDLEFLPDDLHLTPAGHAEYAANVADAIR